MQPLKHFSLWPHIERKKETSAVLTKPQIEAYLRTKALFLTKRKEKEVGLTVKKKDSSKKEAFPRLTDDKQHTKRNEEINERLLLFFFPSPLNGRGRANRAVSNSFFFSFGKK